MWVILIISKWEKYPLANVYKLESSMSPKQREQIASGLTSLLVKKILTSKTLQVHWKVNFDPCG